MILRGRVRTGLGDLAGHMERLRDLYRDKVGVLLYPGSLNVELGAPFTFPACDIRIEPGEGGSQVGVTIMACRIGRLGLPDSEPGFLVRTDGNAIAGGDHPLRLIEVCAAVRLRDRFELEDGDEVEVQVCD